MGSWTDLTQDELNEWKKLRELFQEGKPYVSPMEQGFAIDLYKNYGYKVMEFVITQCCLNKWPDVQKFKHCARLVRTYGIDKVEWAIERMHGLMNHSLDTVEGILKGSIPAYRKKLGETTPVKKSERPSYPTADHTYDKYSMGRWMSEHEHEPSTMLEFFEYAGTEPGTNFQLLKLKPEYR